MPTARQRPRSDAEIAFGGEVSWRSLQKCRGTMIRGQAMRPSLTTLNSTFGMLSPADGITAARNKRDSACPAGGSVSSLHHIRGRDHGSFWHFCDITRRPHHVRFSNRPFGVKRFQTTHHYSVDVARGLVLLFGIGTKALPSWDSKIRWNNLPGGLAVKQTVGPSGHANSPHPSSREGHHSTARWSSSFPPML